LASQLTEGLAAALADSFGPVEIVDLTRITAGASRETWRFDAVLPDRTIPLVVQMDGPATVGGSCAREGALLRAVAACGAPVAEVVAVGDVPNPIGRSFVVSRRLEGETIARKLLRDERWATARSSFVDDCARAMARIHALEPEAASSAGVAAIDAPLDWLRALYLALDDPHPAMELGLRWLDRNPPPVRPTTLVHGDFRLGNLLLDDDGLAAVLDWELAHMGDPAEDLGWLCVRAWRFGGAGRVAGIGSADALLAAYNEHAGASIDEATLRWWELYGTIRWGVICLQMGGAFRRGHSDSLELAMIGRRVIETEYDVTLLLRDLVAP
jgi:aminoglycoside phosphotransferase (APT) family kinase protein